MLSAFFYHTILGTICITEDSGYLTSLKFFVDSIPEGFKLNETSLLYEANRQLQEYLGGSRRFFSLPLSPKGTPFQQRVWSELQKIPFGETRTYGQLAKIIGNPHAYRAVGGANNKNPLPIFIPCHRVIGSDGSLTGYALGLEIKRYLLTLEGIPA